MSQQQYWVTGDGATTAWTLPATPYGLVQVFYDGVLQPPNQVVSVVGKVVTVAFVAGGAPLPEEIGFIFYGAPAPVDNAALGGSSLIQVSEVVNDPDFAQPFTILRSTGSWVKGVFVSSTTEVAGYGVIANPTDRELQMIPEGDRIGGARVFWSSQPIYGTHATAGVGGLSDILIWRGLNFRVLTVQQFEDWGFYRAIAVRMKAD